MHENGESTTMYAAGEETQDRGAAKMRSRRLVVAVLAAIAVIAAGVGPAVSVGDVLDDGEPTHTAFVFDHSIWGATWS